MGRKVNIVTAAEGTGGEESLSKEKKSLLSPSAEAVSKKTHRDELDDIK